MDYILAVVRLGQNAAFSLKKSLGTAFDKLFDHPWLLALFVGAAILMVLWSLKPR